MATKRTAKPSLDKRKAMAAESNARADAWQNLATGMGDPNLDKLLQGNFLPVAELQYGELESLYYGDDMAERIVDALPDEAFRRGFTLEGPLAEEAGQAFAELNGEGAVRDAYGWGRLWGGYSLVPGIDDGQTADQPLKLDNVRGVKWMNGVDRRYTIPNSYYSNPLLPKFGQPETYSISPPFGETKGSVIVHESRLINFYGTKIDAVTTRRLAGWSYSVLQRPYDVLRIFATAFQSAGQLMTDAGQGVFEISQLMMQLSGSQKNEVLQRLTMLDMQRSSGRMLITDKDNENFHREPVAINGVADLLEHFEMRLAAAARMPVTMLMGRSPAGENATGESDTKLWSNSVKAAQAKDIEPKLVRLLDILTAGRWSADKTNKVVWAAMEEPNDKEDAEVALLKAQAWKIYSVDIGAISGEGVAMVEFLDKPIGDVLDEETLQAVIDDDNELAKNPPPPPTVVVAPPAANPLPPGAPNGPTRVAQQAPGAAQAPAPPDR